MGHTLCQPWEVPLLPAPPIADWHLSSVGLWKANGPCAPGWILLVDFAAEGLLLETFMLQAVSSGLCSWCGWITQGGISIFKVEFCAWKLISWEPSRNKRSGISVFRVLEFAETSCSCPISSTLNCTWNFEVQNFKELLHKAKNLI